MYIFKKDFQFLIIILVVFVIIFSSISFVNATTLSLSPSQSFLMVGDRLSVDIILDTEENKTDGVDIKYLNFDNTLFKVEEIFPGTLYPSTQTNEFDNSNGKISFSQITTGGNSFNGSGVLATITFKVLSSGIAKLDFDFEPGNTTDSNVASVGIDVLTEINGGIYEIKNSQGLLSEIKNFFRKLFTFIF